MQSDAFIKKRGKFLTFTAALKCTVLLCFVGCGKQKNAPRSSAPSKVIAARVVCKEIIEWAEVPAQLAPVEKVEVRPRVSGYVDNITFQAGDIVRKGDLLFVIDNRPYQAALDVAQGRLAEAEAQAKENAVNLDRVRNLFSKNLAARQDVDAAIARQNESKARVDTAEGLVGAARLDMTYTQITAPITGRISEEKVTVGNVVEANQTLAQLFSVDPIFAYFNVDEKMVLRNQRANQSSGAQVASVPVYLAVGEKGNFGREGLVDYVDSKFDATNHTILVRALFSNARRDLIPGESARLRFPATPIHPAVLISDEAVVSDRGLDFVYVVAPDGRAKATRVALGGLIESLRIVRSGLNCDDMVILEGLLNIRPGSLVSITEGDMYTYCSTLAR